MNPNMMGHITKSMTDRMDLWTSPFGKDLGRLKGLALQPQMRRGSTKTTRLTPKRPTNSLTSQDP